MKHSVTRETWTIQVKHARISPIVLSSLLSWEQRYVNRLNTKRMLNEEWIIPSFSKDHVVETYIGYTNVTITCEEGTELLNLVLYWRIITIVFPDYRRFATTMKTIFNRDILLVFCYQVKNAITSEHQATDGTSSKTLPLKMVSTVDA